MSSLSVSRQEHEACALVCTGDARPLAAVAAAAAAGAGGKENLAADAYVMQVPVLARTMTLSTSNRSRTTCLAQVYGVSMSGKLTGLLPC